MDNIRQTALGQGGNNLAFDKVQDTIDRDKKSNVGTHPFLWSIWSFISNYTPFLLPYIGAQPPRFCSTHVLNIILFIYFVCIHFLVFRNSDCSSNTITNAVVNNKQ